MCSSPALFLLNIQPRSFDLQLRSGGMNSKARDVDRCSVLPKAGLKDFLQDASFVPHLYINILNIIKYYIIIRCSSTRHFEVVGCWPKMA